MNTKRLTRMAKVLDLLTTIIVLAAIVAWVVLGWSDWTEAWAGVLVKIASGAALGLFWSRYIHGLNLSRVAQEHRPVAALSQNILVGLFALGAAIGV